MSAERHAVELLGNTLAWLLAGGELDRIHPGLRGTLQGARTQVDAALKLVPKDG